MTSTTSSSASSCSRPTRWPSKRADGPHTCAPQTCSSSWWWIERAASATVARRMQRDRLRHLPSPCLRRKTRIRPVSRQSAAPEPLDARVVEHRDRDDPRARARRSRASAASSASSIFVAARIDGRAIPAARDLPPITVSSSLERSGRVLAEDDRVGAAKHAEQRASASAILAGAGDQPRDLDQLHEHAGIRVSAGIGRVVVNA